ncbi:MAG: hypothetical protein RIC55_33760 [Pirellulaceae bacterium]
MRCVVGMLLFGLIGVAASGCDGPLPGVSTGGDSSTDSAPSAAAWAGAEGDLSALSDEFENPALMSQWKRVFEVERTGADQLEVLDIGRTRDGWLTMTPYTSTWYQDYRGVLVHKDVAGDFVVTTRVAVNRRGGDGPPRSNYSLAGIMIRTPRDVTPQSWRPGGENYVFLSLGAARQAGRYAFEVKTTVDSRSNLEVTETESGVATIQVARIGPHLVLLRKPEGGDWAVHRRYHRADMPATLQVGMTVYTDYAHASRLPPAEHNRQAIRDGEPDLTAAFDFYHFRRPSVPAELRGRAFSDPRAVSDAEILRMLGDAAR